VCNEWTLLAVKTTIKDLLLYFSPYSCNILHSQQQQPKVFSIFCVYSVSLFTQNWVSLHSCRKKCVGLPPQTHSLAPWGRVFGFWVWRFGGLGILGLDGVPSPWPSLPYHINLDSSLVIVIIHFQIKSSKMVYWWRIAHCHSRFQRRYVDLACTNLVSRFGPREIMVSLLRACTTA